VLGCESGHGGAEYEQILSRGEMVLQFHHWDAHEHPHMENRRRMSSSMPQLVSTTSTSAYGCVFRYLELGSHADSMHVAFAPVARSTRSLAEAAPIVAIEMRRVGEPTLERDRQHGIARLDDQPPRRLEPQLQIKL
jgi:hypothetical protein